jgi:hypothetical protein
MDFNRWQLGLCIGKVHPLDKSFLMDDPFSSEMESSEQKMTIQDLTLCPFQGRPGHAVGARERGRGGGTGWGSVGRAAADAEGHSPWRMRQRQRRARTHSGATQRSDTLATPLHRGSDREQVTGCVGGWHSPQATGTQSATLQLTYCDPPNLTMRRTLGRPAMLTTTWPTLLAWCGNASRTCRTMRATSSKIGWIS